MLIFKAFLCFFWLIVSPLLVGVLPIHFTKKEDGKNLINTFLIGYIFNIGIFEIVALPLIFMEKSFKMLLYTYCFVISILMIISIIILIRQLYKSRKTISLKRFKIKKISFLSVVVIIIIGFQLYMQFAYAHINNDDVSFVALSTSMIESDMLYKHNGNGKVVEDMNLRRALSPISGYFAVISELVNIHPTIVTHSIMPCILIILAYSVYYLLGKKLFNNNKESISIFLIVLSFLYMYINTMLVHNYYFLLYTWLGRAILSSIILPFIWLKTFDCMDKENKLIDWIILLFAVLAGCTVTSMAVPLIPTTIGLFSLICSIRDKKVSYIFKSIACIMPCVIIGISYLLIK